MRDFTHSTNVLIKAYMNDTLKHGDCCACAVGNLIADAMELRIGKCHMGWSSSVWVNKYRQVFSPQWGRVFSTNSGKRQQINPESYEDEAKEQIDSTGYTWEELASIEKAFEYAGGSTKADRMFKGLVAVFNVLADIHEVDLTTRAEALDAVSAAK